MLVRAGKGDLRIRGSSEAMCTHTDDVGVAQGHLLGNRALCGAQVELTLQFLNLVIWHWRWLLPVPKVTEQTMLAWLAHLQTGRTPPDEPLVSYDQVNHC